MFWKLTLALSSLFWFSQIFPITFLSPVPFWSTIETAIGVHPPITGFGNCVQVCTAVIESMTIIASIALNSRSPSKSAGVSKASYAALCLKPVCLLLPDVPSTSKFWIGNKWYSKFWLVFSAGSEKVIELIPVNFFIDRFLKPLRRIFLPFSIHNR